nr:hypothetical protein [Tanacetum cinerariifolium]
MNTVGCGLEGPGRLDGNVEFAIVENDHPDGIGVSFSCNLRQRLKSKSPNEIVQDRPFVCLETHCEMETEYVGSISVNPHVNEGVEHAVRVVMDSGVLTDNLCVTEHSIRLGYSFSRNGGFQILDDTKALCRWQYFFSFMVSMGKGSSNGDTRKILRLC